MKLNVKCAGLCAGLLASTLVSAADLPAFELGIKIGTTSASISSQSIQSKLDALVNKKQLFEAAGGKAGVLKLASNFDPISFSFGSGVTAFNVSIAPTTATNGDRLISFIAQTGAGTPTKLLQFDIDVTQTLFNLDPSIQYSYTFTNFTAAPLTLTQAWALPMSPAIGAGPTKVQSALSGTLVDNTRNGIALTPTGPGNSLQTSYFGNGGVSGPFTIDTDLSLGGTFSRPAVPATANNSYGYGAFEVGIPTMIAGPDGPFNAIRIQDNFTISARDSIGLTGRTVMVPEPATSALIIAGLAAMGWIAARRRGH